VPSFNVKLILSLFLLTASSASSWAQYTAYKSADGVLVVCDKPGHYFSLLIPGHSVHLVRRNEVYVLGKPEEVAHPYFMVGSRFVQLMPLPIAEFNGDVAANDEAILRQQAQYELNAQHPILSSIKLIPLPNGRTALFYFFRVRKSGPASENQLFVTWRERNYVVLIGSNVPKGDSDTSVQSFLLRIASSFRGSSRPIPSPTLPRATD